MIILSFFFAFELDYTPLSTTIPALITHADWSKHPAKRWVATAERKGSRYHVASIKSVGPTGTWLESLLSDGVDRGTFSGFDFPIGLPAAYASVAGIRRFLDVLPSLGNVHPWLEFYDTASSADEIGIHRPFYPTTPGGRSRTQLLHGLGLAEPIDLYRQCEVARSPRANSLFWTLGAKQVGRAAIAGWREIVAPAIARGSNRVAVWPFDGDLTDLLASRQLVLAETYPGDGYAQIWPEMPRRVWSKRAQTDRKAWAPQFFTLGKALNATFGRRVAAMIRDGFGESEAGEDAFDALVGVLVMIQVVRRPQLAACPATARVRSIEGWILGRPEA